jgi:Mu transposase, C-terminal domain
MVTVKGYVDRVAIIAAGQVIATHARCLKRHTLVLDPLHYLATLVRKPAALDHSPVYRQLELPACFADFRAELETLHGALAGARAYVRVLQLLADHPLARVHQALEACRRDQLTSAEAVIQRTRSLAAIESRTRDSSHGTTEPGALPQVHVPLPDLKQFNHLLGGRCVGDGVNNETFAVSSAAAVGDKHVTVVFA